MNNEDWIKWAKANGATSTQHNTAINEVTKAVIGNIPEDYQGNLAKYLEDTHGLTGSLSDKLFRFEEHYTRITILNEGSGIPKGYLTPTIGEMVSDGIYRGEFVNGIYTVGTTINCVFAGAAQPQPVMPIFIEGTDVSSTLAWAGSGYTGDNIDFNSYLVSHNGEEITFILNAY